MQLTHKFAWLLIASVLCLTGCKNEVSVTVNGGGVVTSSPAGINCDDGGSACKYKFAKNTLVTFSATPNEGYAFTGWDGSCSGNSACTFLTSGVQTLSAAFVLNTGDIEPPSSPTGMINAVGVDELQILWAESSDNMSAAENIAYDVFVSEQREGLVDMANHFSQISGDEPLDASITDLLPGTEHFVAIVAIDESGNRSIPAVLATATPTLSPTIRDDVIVHLADEEGWSNPVFSEAESTYVYTLPGNSIPPEVDSFVAYPVDVDQYSLTKVTGVNGAGSRITVTARNASVFEISDDVRFAGSVDIVQSTVSAMDHGAGGPSSSDDRVVAQAEDEQTTDNGPILPEADESCDRIITDELIFNPNLRAPSVFEYII